MKPEGPLPYSQATGTDIYHVSDESSLHPSIPFIQDEF
jgi:hypothetical protein